MRFSNKKIFNSGPDSILNLPADNPRPLFLF
jgi:hypothetical protein